MKLENRKHIVYCLDILGQQYIGCTNVEPKLGIEGSLRRRIAKHWYRLKDEKRRQWLLYQQMAQLESREDIGYQVIAVTANKREGHTLEQQWLKDLEPVLNSDQ
jgi:hypothetical protein